MAKTIWARIGMSLTVSDEEYDKLKKEADGDDLDLDDDLAERFVEDGEPDGESYIPYSCWEFCKTGNDVVAVKEKSHAKKNCQNKNHNHKSFRHKKYS